MRTCEFCGDPLTTRHQKRFCSYSCLHKFNARARSRTGPANSNWRGGERQFFGRWYVWLPLEERDVHPTYGAFGNYIARSHLNWNQAHPDNPVLKGEVVHHRDLNKTNDDPSNLEKLPGQSEHAQLHGTERQQASHCPKGHPYDEANTYWRPDGRGRDCRACRAEANRRIKADPAKRERLRANKRRHYHRKKSAA